MFGREPLTDGLELVVCNHCSKPVLASRFCAHLGSLSLSLSPACVLSDAASWLTSLSLSLLYVVDARDYVQSDVPVC
jgi:hypothetical protein